MTEEPPQKGSVDGQHGLPTVNARGIRIFVDGDLPKGVRSWDADEGWADVLRWHDDGYPMHDGEDFVTQRIYGKVRVIFAPADAKPYIKARPRD